jgi:hypothetical protein
MVARAVRRARLEGPGDRQAPRQIGAPADLNRKLEGPPTAVQLWDSSVIWAEGVHSGSARERMVWETCSM